MKELGCRASEVRLKAPDVWEAWQKCGEDPDRRLAEFIRNVHPMGTDSGGVLPPVFDADVEDGVPLMEFETLKRMTNYKSV